MCGIAGIVDPGQPSAALQAIVTRMTRTIVHRGPDDEGLFCSDGVAIGMRRLSIIDVAGGRQPIASEDGTIQVVLNGEIYNYPQLRLELERNGHRFRTASDTETIVHAYEESGPDVFTRLRGMFAAAIWDARERRLVLGRDRLGKKPLYYAAADGRLLFGSEIKALLAADPSLREPDPRALEPYFRFGFVPEPGTFFRHIRTLPAAHALECRDGRVATSRYWHLRPEPDGDRRPAAEWAEELDTLLAEAVRIRLMSEVPLGTFLSGGLDSSAIVAYAHRAGLRPLKTFTIGFDRPDWDESPDAKAVAARFDTDHHLLRLREADLARSLPDTLTRLVHHFDEPFGDSSALPTYHVSRLAREHVTVILSGDGGDELFAGYTLYRGFRFSSLYMRAAPRVMRAFLPRALDLTAGFLPLSVRYRLRRAAKVLRHSELPFAQRYVSKMALADDALLGRLLVLPGPAPGDGAGTRDLPPDVYDVFAAALPAVSKLGYADIRFRLLNDMLVKVDRMSMAHSLEVRSPLLDHRLVEFAARLPPDLKLRGWQGKALFRDVLRPMLPASTMAKRKQGFSVPLREWLRTELADVVGDFLLTGSAGLRDGQIRGDEARRIVEAHRRGVEDHSAIIWLLLVYLTWYDAYIGRR